MKIYVIGSCQAVALSNCLAMMNPDAPVERFPTGADVSGLRSDGDVVFRQRESLAMTHATHTTSEVLFPGIWFASFHPAVVYVVPSGSVLPPFGGEHSSLVLYGWHSGLSIEQTKRLFCEAVFEHLNFLDCWDAAKRIVLAEAEAT